MRRAGRTARVAPPSMTHLIGGMTMYEAINHAFTTLPTGGFSTRNTSIAAYDSVGVELGKEMAKAMDGGGDSGIHFDPSTDALIDRLADRRYAGEFPVGDGITCSIFAPAPGADPGRGGMIDGLDEALVGVGVGEEKTFTTQLVAGDLVGQDVEVKVKVTQVQEQELPELDDDFAQEASEFDTLEELREDVRERLTRGKRLEQAAAARDAVLEALLEKVEVPLPETMVTEELNARRIEHLIASEAFGGATDASVLSSYGVSRSGAISAIARRSGAVVMPRDPAAVPGPSPIAPHRHGAARPGGRR